MKILYVEDQLSQNINRILQLFGDGVGLATRIKRQLREWEHDEYGASNEEIRDLLNESGVIDVAIDFPSALQIIEDDWEKYDIFIVDRQLAEDVGAYSIGDIQKVVPDFSVEQLDRYLSREGDYLLVRLVQKGDKSLTNMFYFMTGYNDKLRVLEEMSSLFDAGWFSSDQLLEKGNDDHLKHLTEIIKKAPGILLHKRHIQYFDILDSLTGDMKHQRQFVKLLQACDSCKAEDRSQVLKEARPFLEALVGLVYKTKCDVNPVSDKFSDKIKELSNCPSVNDKTTMVVSQIAWSMGLTAYAVCSKYMHAIEAPSEDEMLVVLHSIRGFILEIGKVDKNDAESF